jgi:CheY-like chemotaxis protein
MDYGLPVVLVVDDERIVADTLAMILGKAGFCAMKAYGAEEALALARFTPPTLLLTDVQMPGMSGVELALEVIRDWPECQVLLFSGHATPRDLAVAKAAGYNFPLLSKPLHPAELLDEISARLGLVLVRA